MKSITVFCGSNTGHHPAFEEEAYRLGKILAQREIRLVYGGAKVGLMGAVARGHVDHGGRTTGVLPHFLRTKEVAHDQLDELILVETMHERKHRMNELCDGVIALPGGFGTMEELFEMLTWAQLGLHQKPIGLLNLNGFYDGLIHFIQQMVAAGFLKQMNQDMLLIAKAIEPLLDSMERYVAPAVPKWITKATT